MPDWGEIFRPSAPISETLVRGTVMFLAIYTLMRVAGKREGGAHSLSDLLVVLLVAEAAAYGMAGDSAAIADSLLLVATILVWSVAIDALTYHIPYLRGLIKASPSPLIADGRINERALRREFMARSELMSELRLHGITEVGQVARAYLEPNGMVSVIRADAGEVEEPQKPSVT